MAKAQQAVAVRQENQVAAFSDEIPDYIKRGQNRGSEEVTNKDLVLPRLEIVQAQSPIKETNEDARDGMFFNSATGDLIGSEAYFIPVYFRAEYLIWKDQDSGGGFFGAFNTQSEAEQRLGEVVSNGEDRELLEIVDTPVHYGLLVDPAHPDVSQQIVISMPKSKAKVSRKWNATIQIVGGDRFSRVYKLTTFTDKNKQGKTFKNFVVQPAGFAPENHYRTAEALYEIFKTQHVSADHAGTIDAEAGPGERGEV